MTAELSIVDVGRDFGSQAVLRDVTLKVAAGSYAVLLGPSGCGKTTLLLILGGFLDPTRGRVLIGGRDVTGMAPARRPTTTVFQDYALFPHMSILENVGFGQRMRGLSRRERDAKSLEFLDLVGLAGSERKKPHELSGGQRQRVALARALAVNPDVLLLDEPLGALDLNLRRLMQDELKSIQRRIGTTFVHVTHDQEEAMAIADEIIVMDKGTVMDSGHPDKVYLRPRNQFTAAFMGEANFLNGRMTETGSRVQVETEFGSLELPSEAFIGGNREVEVQLFFRPESIRLGMAPAGALALGDAIVEDSAFLGTHRRCLFRLNDSESTLIKAWLRQGESVSAGQSLPIWIGIDSILCY